MEKRKFITLKTGRNTYRKIDFDDILIIKANGAYFDVFCSKDKFTVSGKTFEKLEEELKDTELVRINRSCIVNTKKCVELKDCACPEIKLINNAVIKPITMNLTKLKNIFNIES
ncbi:MAG: LytTR family DNA-binding domain-containing protein [Bacteroidales bacterium]|nr:LytTR family DNA-binding domain-containing protein [Bacteroidales bacterium]